MMSTNSNASSLTPLVLFGSQTGTAESIAQLVAEECTTQGQNARCFSMLDYVKSDKELTSLTSEGLVILVCSTTGDGDIPSNGEKFFRVLSSTNRQDKKVRAKDNSLPWLNVIPTLIHAHTILLTYFPPPLLHY